MPPRHRQERLHSSFVVFYFVFVLGRYYDVSRGTVFCSPILGEQNYVYSFPLKQKTSLSPIVSGKEVPGANSPNTEEPEPLMEA